MGGAPRQLEWGFLQMQFGNVHSENLTDVDSILPGIPTHEIVLKSGSGQIIGQKMFPMALNLMLWECSSRRRWVRWAVAPPLMRPTDRQEPGEVLPHAECGEGS